MKTITTNGILTITVFQQNVAIRIPKTEISYKYSWTTTETGINTITDNADVPTIDATYTINGTKVKSQQKGLNIIRYSDGTTRKILSK